MSQEVNRELGRELGREGRGNAGVGVDMLDSPGSGAADADKPSPGKGLVRL